MLERNGQTQTSAIGKLEQLAAAARVNGEAIVYTGSREWFYPDKELSGLLQRATVREGSGDSLQRAALEQFLEESGYNADLKVSVDSEFGTYFFERASGLTLQ